MPYVLQNLNAQNVLVIIAIALITIHVILGYAVLMNPIFLMIENAIEGKPAIASCDHLAERRIGSVTASRAVSEVGSDEPKRQHDIMGECEDSQASGKDEPADRPTTPEVSYKQPSCWTRTGHAICRGWNNFLTWLRRLPELPKRLVVRCFIIGLTTFVAVLIPFFGYLMGLIGASTIALSSFILPSFFYYRIYKDRMPIWERVVCLGLSSVGLVVGLIASALALKLIIESASTFKVFQ